MSSYTEGQVHQLVDALEAAGFTPEDLRKLGQSKNLSGHLALLRDHAEIKMCEHLIDCDATPFIPNGWSVLPDNEQLPKRVRGSLKWNLAKTKLHLDEGQKGSKFLVGNALREALKAEWVLPANVLDYLLAHPELIPEEWKDKAIFFWGTIYRGSDGNLYVRYLYWNGSQWRWNYNWLDNDWNASNPAVLLATRFISPSVYRRGSFVSRVVHSNHMPVTKHLVFRIRNHVVSIRQVSEIGFFIALSTESFTPFLTGLLFTILTPVGLGRGHIKPLINFDLWLTRSHRIIPKQSGC